MSLNEDEVEQEILVEKVKEKEESSEEDTTSNSCVNHPITLDLLFEEQMKEKTIKSNFGLKEQEYHHWYIKLGSLSKMRMQQLAAFALIVV